VGLNKKKAENVSKREAEKETQKQSNSQHPTAIKKTQKNKAINPKKNRAGKTQQKKNTEKNKNISLDFVPVRNKFFHQKIYTQKRRERQRVTDQSCFCTCKETIDHRTIGY
jgi:hypothetical protein